MCARQTKNKWFFQLFSLRFTVFVVGQTLDLHWIHHNYALTSHFVKDTICLLLIYIACSIWFRKKIWNNSESVGWSTSDIVISYFLVHFGTVGVVLFLTANKTLNKFSSRTIQYFTYILLLGSVGIFCLSLTSIPFHLSSFSYISPFLQKQNQQKKKFKTQISSIIIYFIRLSDFVDSVLKGLDYWCLVLLLYWWDALKWSFTVSVLKFPFWMIGFECGDKLCCK